MTDQAKKKHKKTSYLVKLFRGDISLPVTYWVFGVLIGNIGFLALNKLLELYFFNLASHQYSNQLFLIFNLIVVLFTTFIFIAIWRSSNKYVGADIWKNLARLAIIIGAIKLSYGMYTAYGPIESYATSLKQEVILMNKSLPIMLDGATRLDRAEFQGNQLSYYYTLVLASIEWIKLDKFSDQKKKLFLDSSCDKDGLLPALEEGISVNFIFFDKNNIEVTTVSINHSDCQKH